MEEDKKPYFDIWGDHVDLKDLLIAIVISITLTLGGYLIAPAEPPMPLVFGLSGGIIGFIICTIIIKPKRKITNEEEETD